MSKPLSVVPQAVSTQGPATPSAIPGVPQARLTGPRLTAADFYVPTPDVSGLQAGANALGQAGIADQEVKSATNVKSIDTGFARWSNDYLYKDDGSYYSKRGVDAANAYEPTIDVLVDMGNQYIDKGANEAEKRMLKATIEQQITGYQGKMVEHQRSQKNAWEVSTNLGRAQAAGQQASNAWDDSAAVDRSAKTIWSSTFTAATIAGKSTEEATAMANDAQSTTYRSIGMLRMNKNPTEGLAYYETIKDKLTQRDRQEMDSAVTSTRIDVESDAKVRSIMPSAARMEWVNGFKAAGFSDMQAAHAAAHFGVESGYSTTVERKGDANDGSPSIGSGQWNMKRLHGDPTKGDNREGLFVFAANRGMDWRDRSTQIKFAVYEMTGPESKAGQALKNAQTDEQAADAMISYFRPKGSEVSPRNVPSYGERLAAGKATMVEANPDRATKDMTAERIQSVRADTQMDPRVKEQTIAKLMSEGRTEEMRRISALKDARDKEDASIVETMTGQRTPADLSARLMEGATIARGAGDRSEALRLEALAAQAPSIASFSQLPLNKQKEALASMMQGLSAKMAGSQIAVDKEKREQDRVVANQNYSVLQEAFGQSRDANAVADLASKTFVGFMGVGDYAKAIEVQQKFNAYAQAKGVAELPRTKADSVMAEMKYQMDKNGVEVNTVYLHDYLTKMMDKQESLRKSDPFTYAEQLLIAKGQTQPVALNFLPNPQDKAPYDTLKAQLAARSKQASDGSLYTGYQIPPFRSSEVEMLWNALDQANPSQKQQLLSTIATGIDPQMINRIAPMLSQKGPAGDGYLAAMLQFSANDSKATTLGNRILRGADLLYKGGEAGKDIGPSDIIWRSTINEKLGNTMNDMAPEGQRVVLNAVRALYTEDRGKAGDRGQPVDDIKLAAAIKDVVGEIDTVNGRMTAMPDTDVSRRDFKWMVRYGIDEQVLAGLRSRDGTQITANTLADHAVFGVVGKARYQVLLPDPKDNNALKPIPDPHDRNKPWVLDMQGPMSKWRRYNDRGDGTY